MTNSAGRALFSALIVGFFFCLGNVAVNSALAHGVVVFAWVEGDTVHVESKFSGGRRVNAGELTVLDAKGNELLRGTTDSEGNFNFPLPGNDTIKIVLNAGMGHRGQWTVTAADIAAARTDSPSEPHRHIPSAETASEAGTASPAVAARPAADIFDEAAVEAAVERALDRKLAPVLKMLADSNRRGPTLKDIIGGIGYILGLVGLAAFVHSRKKS